jgi:hypothetical protein
MEEIEDLKEKLALLEHEHRDLDTIIERLMTSQPIDLLQIQRLKKKKLLLKDQINRLKSDILPDIIA